MDSDNVQTWFSTNLGSLLPIKSIKGHILVFGYPYIEVGSLCNLKIFQ